MRFLNLFHERSLKNCLTAVDDFAYKVIGGRKKELLAALDASKSSATDESIIPCSRSDLLTVFMGLKDDQGSAFSDKFLRDICVNFILAGRDTSSVALTWFFWLLSKNPSVEEKIVKEVRGLVKEREILREGKVVDDEKIVFSPEEMKNVPYLQAALSEALRLYPSVPVDHKEVISNPNS